MNRSFKTIPFTIILASLLACACGADPVPKDKSDKATDEDIKLLTDVHVSIEAAAVHGGDYRLKTAREAQLDLVKVREWFFHFGIQENSLFDYSPSQLDNRLYYFKIGYETDGGRVSFFWDHTCNNPTRKLPEGKYCEIHWNEFGIGYETNGMRLGHKNDGIEFDNASKLLNKINWNASLSRIWMKNDNDYEYMLKLGMRDDILRIGNHIFYAQLILNSIYDNRGINYISSVEAGDRICLADNINLVPFTSYEHFHDWYGLSAGEDFYFAGLRLEASLGPDNSNGLSKNHRDFENNISAKNTEERLPRFHVDGGYNQNLRGTKKGSNSSDVDFDLDLLRFDEDKVITLNTYAGILTKSGGFDIQNINYKIGPSLNIDLADSHLRLFHSYSCLYGGQHEGVIRKQNIIGAEIGRNDRLSWNIMGAVYPSTTNFDYDAHLQTTMGYDFYIDKWYIPYLNGSLKYLLGGNSVFGNAVEGGLKFPGEIGDFVVYLRLEDSFDVFRFGEGEQVWLGFRIVL